MEVEAADVDEPEDAEELVLVEPVLVVPVLVVPVVLDVPPFPARLSVR